ncbi:hypothetical protein ACSQ76_02645 [Roseovarius sp. B08]|uniref:hypothetical protein n=1 Tax=Roseovarius sp. B08 TaxID=3449223 RepID=UPI003EDC9915
MFERNRAPLNILLESDGCVSHFVDFEDPNVAKMLANGADAKRAKDIDALCWVVSRALSDFYYRDITRELAFACALLVNAVNSFPTISKAIAVGDLTGGLAIGRVSLEGLVRGTALVCSTEEERERALYNYENDFRDSYSRQRKWLGSINENDSFPRKIGKMFSNPLNEDKSFVQSGKHGMIEGVSNLPSNKSIQRNERELKFKKFLEKIDCFEGQQEAFIRWIEDWHSLSSSFVHADAFSVHITNSLKMFGVKSTEDRKLLYFDLMQLLTTLFVIA